MEPGKKGPKYDFEKVRATQGVDAGLLFAAKLGRVGDMLQMLDEGANPDCRDAYGNTPLILASMLSEDKERTAAVMALLNHHKKPDVNLQNRHGDTALMWLSASGDQKLVDELRKVGARTDLRDDTGATALTWAERRTLAQQWIDRTGEAKVAALLKSAAAVQNAPAEPAPAAA